MRLCVAAVVLAACSVESSAFEPVRSNRAGGFEELHRSQPRQPVSARAESPKVPAPPREAAPDLAATPAIPPPLPPVRIAVALPPQPKPPVFPQEVAAKPDLTLQPAPQVPSRSPTISEMAASNVLRAADERYSMRMEDAPVTVAMAPPAAATPAPPAATTPAPSAAAPSVRQILPGLGVILPGKSTGPDTAWNDKLTRALGDGERLGIPAGVLGDLRRFYAARGMRPLFTDGTVVSRVGEATIDVSRRAETHGLDARRLAGLIAAAAGDGAALREVALAGLAVAYARDARGARFNPAQLGSLVVSRPAIPDPQAVLTALADAPEPATVLEGFNPQHAGYRALREQLALARKGAFPAPAVQGLRPIILHGPELDVGMMDPRVTLLRQRLSLPAAADVIYDEDISDEVLRVQRSAGFTPTGVLDRQTIDHLNGTQPAGAARPDPVTGLILNMERWRWLPADLGNAHVFVNIPAFTLQFRSAGQVPLTSRVIVGEASTPTPIMSHRIEHMIINPSWHVPPNIARREYMPLLKDAPEELAEEGIKVQRTADGVRFYQPPGDRNGLGRIKLVFPNPFTVHLHDTPDRELFASEFRADSNGCVRVEDPFALAEAVLGGSHSKAQLTGMIGPREKRIDLVQKVPVHLAYFTYEVQADGTLAVYDDVYGHDRKMRAAMGF